MRYPLAVDVGSCYVKVVEACERNRRFFLEKIFYFPNPFPEFRTNLIEHEQDIFVKILRQFIRKKHVKEKRTISNISGPGTVIHYFDIPKLSDEEIGPAVQIEMMQVVPGGTKNLEYDYTVFPEKSGNKTIFLVGYQKDRCEFFTNTLVRAGLKPLIIDCDSLAVLNCFNYFNTEYKEELVFILNIGHRNTNFVLAEKDEKFILIRDIPFGCKDIVKAVAKNKGIPIEDAEIYISRKENIEEVKKVIESDLEDPVFEIRRGMEYFKKKTEKSPETLFLTGGTSTIPGVCETLQENIKIKTILWNPLEHLTNTKNTLLPDDIKKKGYMFTVALGLALRKIR